MKPESLGNGVYRYRGRLIQRSARFSGWFSVFAGQRFAGDTLKDVVEKIDKSIMGTSNV